MEKPLVSIIVPVYKVPEQYLRKCIESLMNQTLQNIEILLVDDGSPDDCGEICDTYAEKDERIKVLHKENGGVSLARNEGIDISSGKYISFLDADDWIDLDTFRYVVEKAEKQNVKLVSWNHFYNYEYDYAINVPRKSMPEEEFFYTREDIKKRLIYDFITPEFDARKYQTNLGAIRGVWSKLYDTDVIKKNNIRFDKNLKIGEDASFNINYVRKIDKVLFINKYFNHYRISDGSANHMIRKDIVDLRIALLKKYRELFDNTDENFWICYIREVLSCVINCLTKYYCESNLKLDRKQRILKINQLLEQEDIKVIGKEKRYIKRDFFKFYEKILYWLIVNDKAVSLYICGKVIIKLKRRKK